MKIISLLTAKNESWVIENCLKSLVIVSDEIIAIDDHSTDDTKKILKNYNVKIIEPYEKSKHGWNEYLNRQLLLNKGREIGGTHFIVLDADEAFSYNFIYNSKNIILSLQPGQKLNLQWLALWKSSTQYLDDSKSIFSNNFKDFIFCDNGENYEKTFLHLPRTPISKNNSKKIDLVDGAVLHFQFTDWRRFQLKQAWYYCSELIEYPETEAEINKKYSITKDNNYKLTKLSKSLLSLTPKLEFLKSEKDSWHYNEIVNFFYKFGILYFEKLDIWDNEDLLKIFLIKENRHPKNQYFLLDFINRCKKKLISLL